MGTQARYTEHRTIENTALPYVSNTSPTSAGLQYVAGSNVLTSILGQAERRPGFGAALESAPVTLGAGETVQRIYTFRKWSGDFYVMYGTADATQSYVYKVAVGTNATAVKIYTDTGSSTPFDFVFRNNTCYFSNGHVVKKFLAATTADTTVYNWGITKPAAAPSISVSAGNTGALEAAAASGTNWTDPTFILVDDAQYAVYNNTAQDDLKITQFPVALPTGTVPVGVSVSIKGNGASATLAQRYISVGLTKDGTALVGTRKTMLLPQTTDSTQTIGGASDLWGTTLTKAEAETSTFGVLIKDYDTTAASLNLNYITITLFYAATNTLNSESGYYYCVTYCNSATGHESSPSAVSSCTGVFSGSLVSVTLVASADTQVNQIRVYRSTDGGSTDPTLMREITGSPFTNTNQVISDTTADTSLSTRTGPALNRNDPPPPMIGMVTSPEGRIWGFADATSYFSGLEEISNGVPEESFPSGLDGNFYKWDSAVTGHATMDDGIAVFISQRIYKVEGDTLDSMRRYKMLDRRGALNHTAVCSVGGVVAWLDTASQVWFSEKGEIGIDIRPDIAAIDHTQASIAIHISGTFHHLCLLDGANGKLYVYDLDTGHWMPPWNVGTTATALCSGETATGTVDLLLARNGTKVVKQTKNTYTDDGSTYASSATLGLLHVSEASRGNPAWRGVVDWIEAKTNAVILSNVSQLNDDDPASGTYTSIGANVIDPPDVPQGTYIKLKRYPSMPDTNLARMSSIKLDWAAATTNWKLYTLDIAYHAYGG